jgi:LytR cell envelope-related transcriptional attenuator
MSFARVRALVVVGVLLLAAAVFVVMALVRDSQGDPKAAAGCPKDAVLVNTRLPDENKDVKLKIFNGTAVPGLAEKVGEDFSHRGFTVDKKKGDNPKAVSGVAVLRFGPKAVGAAWLLRAYFLQEAEPQFDAKRRNDVVDVVVGKKFQQLATETEVKQSLTQLGNPSPPAGTCPADTAA